MRQLSSPTRRLGILFVGLFCLATAIGCGGGMSPGPMGTPVSATHELESPNTEDYNKIVENPFLDAASNPLATLAVTVDTASYSNVRRFLQQERKLPPKDSVRVAELVNYFSYDYPEPTGKHPLEFLGDISVCPWNPKHRLVRIALKGKSLSPDQMPARNFVFLLDTSGSMSDHNKLPLLRRSLGQLVKQLSARDRVSVVAYAGSAGLVLPPTPGNQRDRILSSLDRLDAGGSTNGGQGIELAYRIAQQQFIPRGLNRVILGTDGDFNVGLGHSDLIRLIERKRQSGIYLTVLGLGMGNLKDGTMENLARHGNGHYAYLDSDREARKVFVEQGGALVTIAKDVKFQVEFNPAKVGAYRLIGYENRLLRAEDFNDDTKDTTDIGSGHTITVFFEVVPVGVPLELPGIGPLKYQRPSKPASGANSDEWLTIKLRYKHPQSDVSELITQPLMGEPIAFGSAPKDFRFAASVAEFGLLLFDSKYKGQSNFAQVKDIAQRSIGDDQHGHRREFLGLVETASRLER